MDDSNVDKMLEKSVKKSTLAKYGRAWDKWSIFATYHGVDVVPPDMQALAIFVANTAKLSGSAGVASMSEAAITHFSALEGVQSPFTTPRFGKILRGIRNEYGKPVKPKKPFSRLHITTFMDWARGGSLLDWRAALPMALCYQQLLRGAEAFDLNGSNVDRRGDHFWVEVETSENHPEGFRLKARLTRIALTTLEHLSSITLSRWGLSLGTPSLISLARSRRSKAY
jgi:integrase